jgi:hypothetical protein
VPAPRSLPWTGDADADLTNALAAIQARQLAERYDEVDDG